MNFQHAIERLEIRIQDASNINNRQEEYNTWVHHTWVDLEEIFGKDHEHKKRFASLRATHIQYIKGFPSFYHSQQENIPLGKDRPISIALPEQITHLKECIKNLQSKIKEAVDSFGTHGSLQELVLTILRRFDVSAKALTNRPRQKTENPQDYIITGEYDVQDLLYCILKPIIKDLQRENPLEKSTGKSGRPDLTSDMLGMVIEIKYTKNSERANKIIEECKSRVVTYSKKTSLKHLIFFIYDPMYYLDDPDNFIHSFDSPNTSWGGRQFDVKGIISPHSV